MTRFLAAIALAIAAPLAAIHAQPTPTPAPAPTVVCADGGQAWTATGTPHATWCVTP